MEKDKKVICPFCGKDISDSYSYRHALSFEEKVNSDYSFEPGFGKSILVEHKIMRQYSTYCCESCYQSNQRWDKILNKISMIAIPSGFIAGIIYGIIMVSNNDKASFIEKFFPTILMGVTGIFVFGIPNLILHLLFIKKTSYKHAKECNSLC